MKTIHSLILFFSLFAAGSVSAQQISSAELQVTGLTCSMCSQATEKSLRTLDFIETITPDLNRNIFVIEFKKDKGVNIDQIRNKVEDAGFSVGNLAAVFNFNNAKIDENGQTILGGTVYKFLNTKSRVLNGPVKANVVDRDFIAGSVFKKTAAQYKTETYAAGKGTVNGKPTRIYHLTI